MLAILISLFKRWHDFQGRSSRVEFLLADIYVWGLAWVTFVPWLVMFSRKYRAILKDSDSGFYFALSGLSVWLTLIGIFIFDFNETLGYLFFLIFVLPPAVFGLFCFIVGVIAVSIRRLHDADYSGWWLLLIFVPILGWIWLFVVSYFFPPNVRMQAPGLTNKKMKEGENRFGTPPKTAGSPLQITLLVVYIIIATLVEILTPIE